MRGRGGTGRGGRGMQGRGRGRGRGRDASLEYDDDMEEGGDEDRDDYFEQAASVALPSPLENAYQDAVHTNNMVLFFLSCPFFGL